MSTIAAVSGAHKSLMADPELVEDYAEIVQNRDAAGLGLRTGDLDSRAGGSVIMTPTAAERPDITAETIENYDYSDSEFEEDLQQRVEYGLHDNFSDGEEAVHDEGMEELSDGSSSWQRDKDHEVRFDDSESEENSLGEDASDGVDEFEYPELPPPSELDPDKLYALYPFDGPDSSHCKLELDESCYLLNDEDAYWWLIKRCRDNRIGFAPAEILETHQERVARLNCWKNEKHIFEEEETAEETASSFGSHKKSKSVTFNELVSYADRYLEDYSETDSDTDHAKSEIIQHRDEFTQANVPFTSRDEEDEVISDVSFSVGVTMPLNIKKTRIPKQANDTLENLTNNDKFMDSANKLSHDVDKSDSEKVPSSVQQIDLEALNSSRKNSDVKQRSNSHLDRALGKHDELIGALEPPVLPFSVKSSTPMGEDGITNSNSDYSISTIGEFSPSSTEMATDMPKFEAEVTPRKIESEFTSIPSSKAFRDISKFVKQDPSDIKGGDDEDCSEKDETKEVSGEEVVEDGVNDSKEFTSSEDFYMESQIIRSNTSVNSNPDDLLHLDKSHGGFFGEAHPLIQNLYNPVFTRMDDLMKQIDNISEKL